MGKGHFIFQCILMAIWLLLFIEPIYGLFFAIIVGGVQVFHSLILFSTTKETSIKRHLIYYYSCILILGILYYFTSKYFDRNFLPFAIIPILLAIYFLIITKLVYNKTNEHTNEKDINDFLKPNNNVAE
jgi:low temperature requirement protein LtrA